MSEPKAIRFYGGTLTPMSRIKPISPEAWNEKYPVGTEVLFYHLQPHLTQEAPVRTRTRSEAWLLGGHTPVVQVEGQSGCHALGCLIPVALTPLATEAATPGATP